MNLQSILEARANSFCNFFDRASLMIIPYQLQ